MAALVLLTGFSLAQKQVWFEYPCSKEMLLEYDFTMNQNATSYMLIKTNVREDWSQSKINKTRTINRQHK